MRFKRERQGLNEAAYKSASGQKASHNLSYLRSATWWAGMATRKYSIKHNAFERDT